MDIYWARFLAGRIFHGCYFWVTGFSGGFCSGGRGCLGEGRLGLPCQVWEFRFLASFPSFARDNRFKIVWKTPGSPRHPSTRHPRLAYFLPDCFFSFFAGKMSRKILEENPRQILQNLYNKIPDAYLQRGRANIYGNLGLGNGGLAQKAPIRATFALPQCWKPPSFNLCQIVCTRSKDTSEPPLRRTSESHPNHIRTAPEPHPKQWQKLREKWLLAFPSGCEVKELVPISPTKARIGAFCPISLSI